MMPGGASASMSTSKAVVEDELRGGKSLLFDIDFQGAESLLAYRSDALAVMIFPPSMEVLEQRLRGRGTDNDEVVARRLDDAAIAGSHRALMDTLWSRHAHIVGGSV
jgi:guanylate kinase